MVASHFFYPSKHLEEKQHELENGIKHAVLRPDEHQKHMVRNVMIILAGL